LLFFLLLKISIVIDILNLVPTEKLDI
jgi:hypothetical protein